jgi:hypothetical protein
VAGMDDKSEENFDLVKKMIMVGLKHDFFCTENGGKLGKAETDFLIENEDPPYIIKGYIDKHALYDKGKTLKIIDYKSSKKKFSKDALDGERQAMILLRIAIKIHGFVLLAEYSLMANKNGFAHKETRTSITFCLTMNQE